MHRTRWIASAAAALALCGTARAQAQLRDGLTYTNGYVLPLPEVLAPLALEKFDAESTLTDADTRAQVVDLLKAFAAWTRRLKATGQDMAAAG